MTAIDPHRLQVRQKLLSGTLPRELTARISDGRRVFESCRGCDLPIPPQRLCYEYQAPDGAPLYLHLSCFHFWEQEARLVTALQEEVRRQRGRIEP